MEDNLNDIFDPIKDASLTESERISMRNNVVSFMEAHPVRQPLAIRIRETAITYIQYFNSGAMRPVSFAFALVLVVGVGTSYAAEGALPGDPLYAVKVHFTEKVQGAFAISTTEKVEWNAELLERRLTEAETLAAEGKLTSDASAEIGERITVTAKDFNTHAEALAESEEGTVVAASAQSRVEAAFVGHERVLAALAREIPDSEPKIRPVLALVRAHAEVAETARANTERTIASKKASSVRTAATDSRHVADSTLGKVRIKAAQNTTSAADASTSALAVEQAINAGDEELKAGNYTEAFGTYQAALRAARAVEVNLDAEARLGTDLNATSTNATSTATTTAETDPSTTSTIQSE
jgi:hypothetical protein